MYIEEDRPLGAWTCTIALQTILMMASLTKGIAVVLPRVFTYRGAFT